MLSFVQADQRRVRQWRLLYGVQALADKWRAIERRKDRQRQAFDAAINLASDSDFQQSLDDARYQIEQAASIEVTSFVTVAIKANLWRPFGMCDSHFAAAEQCVPCHDPLSQGREAPRPIMVPCSFSLVQSSKWNTLSIIMIVYSVCKAMTACHKYRKLRT